MAAEGSSLVEKSEVAALAETPREAGDQVDHDCPPQHEEFELG
jgi:hypothetical protein